jgi:hypothetical protein
LDISPDGARLATGSEGGTVRVFELSSGAEVARINHDGPVVVVAFGPDGRDIVSAAQDGGRSPVFSRRVSVQRHALSPEVLTREACARLTRNLSAEEWREYLGAEPYRDTCSALRR